MCRVSVRGVRRRISVTFCAILVFALTLVHEDSVHPVCCEEPTPSASRKTGDVFTDNTTLKQAKGGEREEGGIGVGGEVTWKMKMR